LGKKRRRKAHDPNRSQSEAHLYDLLCAGFPNLIIRPNDKDVIPPLEIDISIPELMIAIEWNGIFHRKAIGGKKRLEKRQRRDRDKKRRLEEMQWDLYIIEHDHGFEPELIESVYVEIQEQIHQKMREK